MTTLPCRSTGLIATRIATFSVRSDSTTFTSPRLFFAQGPQDAFESELCGGQPMNGLVDRIQVGQVERHTRRPVLLQGPVVLLKRLCPLDLLGRRLLEPLEQPQHTDHLLPTRRPDPPRRASSG